MPGLCGVIEMACDAEANEEPSNVLLDRMATALCHFPEDRVLYRVSRGPFWLAAVGYPSSVWRPLLATDGTHVTELWFGEVHDGRTASLPASRGEVGSFVDGVTADPFNSLARISGNFVGSLLNESTGEFHLFNDALGNIPMCFRRVGRRLLFAPESKALLAATSAPVRGDGLSLAFFLSAGYLPSGRTHLSGVRTLSPASVLSGRAGMRDWQPPVSRRYWEYGFPHEIEERRREDYAASLYERLALVVRSQARARERVGICLSGGHDSRGILAQFPRALTELQSVTWGVNPALEGGDAQVAARLAERAAIPHRFVTLDAEALPSHAADWVWKTDGASESLYNYPQGVDVFRALATDFDVLLRGDQSFVKWPYGVPNDDVAQSAIGVYPLEWHSFYDGVLRDDVRRDLTVASRAVHRELSSRLKSQHPLDRKDEYFYELHLFSKMNALNYVKGLAVPIRNPLIDRRFLECVQTLPRRWRRGKGLYRSVIASAAEGFEAEPFATRTNLIPWRQVLARSIAVKRFAEHTLLDSTESFRQLIDRSQLEHRLASWLAAGQTESSGATAAPSPPKKRRWAEHAKSFAFLPWTPALVRNAIVPMRSSRAPMEYLFRLLALALYVQQLEARGIRLQWDWNGGAALWREERGCS